MSDPKKIIVSKASKAVSRSDTRSGQFKTKSIKQSKRRPIVNNRASKTRKGRCGSCKRKSSSG